MKRISLFCDRESAPTKECKMAAMTSPILKFQNPRKTDLANICQIICRKFHQNRSSRLGCSADTDTCTHAHTHTLVSIATYSVKMTECKNNNIIFLNFENSASMT